LQIDVVRPVALAVAPDDTATAVWDGGWSSVPAGGVWAAAGGGVGGATPEVALAPDGTATALWLATENLHTVIQAASRPAGGSWSAAVDISVAGRNADEPSLAVGGDGTATAVWRVADGGHFIVQAATLPPGGAWSAPEALSAPTGDARTPDVAADGDGNATAVWKVLEGSHYVVQAASHPTAGPWSIPLDLSVPGRSANDPHVAVSADDVATVIWSRSDGAHTRIQVVKRWEGRGWPWTTPATISPRGHDADQQQLANAADGTTTAVWRRKDGANWIIQAAVIHAGVVPIVLRPPAVHGRARTGRLLTCDSGAWSDVTLVTVAWYRGGTAIRRATKTAYRVKRADLGSVLTCHVTVADAAGTTVAKSRGLKIRR
jgi:hypothetical protein